MKGMKIYGFNADSYQEVSIDWLTVNTLNMIITEATMPPKDRGRGAAIGLLRTLSINWT